MKRLAVIALSITTAFSGISPAFAFPAVNAPVASQNSTINQNDIVKVRDWHGGGSSYWRHNGRGWHGGGGGWRGGRGYWRSDRGYYRHGGGWRYGRWHRHNDTGAIIGGLAAGAIIGGALASRPHRVYRGGNSHVNWCYARYRSYRASDNTYQPYNGPRRQCVSP